MKKEILCTLGPSSMNDRDISRLEELGVSLFRINLSHTDYRDVADRIEFIQKRTKVPVCLDTEGAQVRTGPFTAHSADLEENSVVEISQNPEWGDEKRFNLYPVEIVNHLVPGDLISIDFNSVLIQVIARKEDCVEARVLIGGTIGQNKAVTVERDLPLSPLTEKDKEALKTGREMGIRHVALSFCSRASDTDLIRAIAGNDIFLISKIESLKGIENLDSIAKKSNALLIDRGDLSRQVPIEQIPVAQKMIIRQARELGVKVYVATNLLESMITASTPTRAEVNDVYNTLADGADGLVLAAETAIGKYPIQSAAMISKIIQVYEMKQQTPVHPLSESLGSLLTLPHGGRLTERYAGRDDLARLEGLKKIKVRLTDLMDCEQIACGTYSPLQGFMTAEELKSVLDRKKLPDETIWTLPVVLQVSEADAPAIKPGERIALTDDRGEIRSLMDVEDIYRFHFDEVATKWFGTNSLEHPGVARLKQHGDFCVGGKISLVKKGPSDFAPYELTPAQTRFLFEKKGWQKIVGFHTRNVPHRVHEYLQLTALEKCHADGLFISPVIGLKKEGDFLADPILKSYQLLIDRSFYPKGKVVLGSFSTYSRYAGPREAVFTALCRKNMGCSHFILGRDHTGVGNFYEEDSNRKIFDEIGTLGITPIFFDPISYNLKKNQYEATSPSDEAQSISGSTIREKLRKGEKLPDWFIRPEIQELLISDLKANIPIFCS